MGSGVSRNLRKVTNEKNFLDFVSCAFGVCVASEDGGWIRLGISASRWRVQAVNVFIRYLWWWPRHLGFIGLWTGNDDGRRDCHRVVPNKTDGA